jgi:IMP dehydrogenase
VTKTLERPPFKELRRAYGFDEVAIVPGSVTLNPEMTSTKLQLGEHIFEIPVLASAMDAVVDINFSGILSQAGGLAVLNLEGLQTRYENPDLPLSKISKATKETATITLQKAYSVAIDPQLVSKRVAELKAKSPVCAVSITPANTKKLAPLAIEAGADIIVVQSTVTTAKHKSKSYQGLDFTELVSQVDVPIVVGNCVTYSAASELLETGIDGLLVGVGPGAACTTREVVGVGVPQVTATIDCSAARDEHYRKTGRYITVITDGGIRTGGDLCKAIAAGSDGVMIGSPFAQCSEAPGQGFNWGMASPHAALPRGTRIDVGIKSNVQQVLFGPTSLFNGTQNLIGALKECMGMCGAETIQDFHQTEMVLAPSIGTEGKLYQMLNRI